MAEWGALLRLHSLVKLSDNVIREQVGHTSERSLCQDTINDYSVSQSNHNGK